MELALHLDNTNVITGMFCLLRGSLQGQSTAATVAAQGFAAQNQTLLTILRAEALPDLATSLPANYVDSNTQDYNGRAEDLGKQTKTRLILMIEPIGSTYTRMASDPRTTLLQCWV